MAALEPSQCLVLIAADIWVLVTRPLEKGFVQSLWTQMGSHLGKPWGNLRPLKSWALGKSGDWAERGMK